MTKKLKKEWIKALKSGKYVQGVGSLWNRKINSYCCLGVLGKICGVTGLSGNLKYEFLDSTNLNLKGLNKVPEELQGTGGLAQVLADMNDKHYTFEEIAQYIEKNL